LLQILNVKTAPHGVPFLVAVNPQVNFITRIPSQYRFFLGVLEGLNLADAGFLRAPPLSELAELLRRE